MHAARIGIGFDIHRLEPDDAPDAGIPLAGVRLPCPYRVLAHSDGDVVLHAVCDALLGAVAAGDLGELFPDHDPAHRGRASSWFVAQVLALPALAGWAVGNVDVDVIAEVPRIGPHRPQLRARLAELLGAPLSAVSIKARTHEGLDAIGERRAVGARAALLLVPRAGA